MTTPVTTAIKEIRAIIEASIEDTRVPDAIAAHADKRVGKTVTKTDAEQLEKQLGVTMRIDRSYGMTRITWGTHAIQLGYSDSGTRWPSAKDLCAANPAYYEARDERNVKRAALLKEHLASICVCGGVRDSCSGCDNGPSAITRAARAIVKLREANAELGQLLEFEQPLYVERFAIEKLVGNKP